MRNYKAILPAAMAMVTVACAPQESLNPLCTNANAVADPALTGVWQAADGIDSLEIRGMWQSLATADSDSDPSESAPPDYRTYNITYVEGKDKKTWTFDGVLIHLGDEDFVDLTARDSPVDADFKYFPVNRSLEGEQPQFTRVAEMFFMTMVPATLEDHGSGSGEPYELKLVPAHAFLKVTLENDQLHVARLDRDWLGGMIHDGRISIDHQNVGETILLTASAEALQDLVRQISDEPGAFKESGDWRRKR